MRPIDKFILHVVHNWENSLNEAYEKNAMAKLMNKFKEEADDLNLEINDEQLKIYINTFDKLRGTERLKEKDLFKYSLSQLIRLITSSKGAEAPESADITPDVVYHNDDNTIVVYNGSKEDNCITYGRGERWCITRGSYATYRYSEGRSYPTFYLAQNNNLSSDDPLSFVAIQVRDPKTTSESQRYVYTNRANSPNESQPMSFNQLENEVPWLREIPNAQQVFRYIPLNTGEKLNQQYKNKAISIREWVNLPFDTKQQYLVVRKGKTLFLDISNDEFLSKYLPKFPQLAEFVAITPGIFQTEELLKHLESFSNSNRRSITANIRDKIDLSNLKSETLPFDVKKLLTKLDKWDLDSNERLYVTKDGNAIVKLNLGDNITLGVYTAEDDYPSIKLNKRTSKYLTDYPELDKIPVKNLIKLVSDEVIDQTLLDQTLEAAKNDPDSAIVVKDTDNGQIIVDSNSFASYKVENGKISQIPFDSEEVQAIFDEQDDNEAFQENVLKIFNSRKNIPDQIDRVGLTSILKSTPYDKKVINTDYLNSPLVVLTTDEENPLIFVTSALPNYSQENPFYAQTTYGIGNNWRDYSFRQRFTPEMLDAYFAYLRGTNQAFSDSGLLQALSANMPTDFKKSIITNPNLPLQDTNIYRPAEYNDIVYLVNTQNPSESKKISDQSGKLIKANIPANKVNRLLGRQPQAAPATEPGAEVEPAVAQLQALAAQGGERRRGRPAGVPNTPRVPQERQRGDINLPDQFADRGLNNGFTNLPRNDFRKLAVNDAVRVPRIGDRGASARDNLLDGSARVTSVFSVGPSKIYFIETLNTPEPETIASINIQPGNRNYVIVGNRAYFLNSPRELLSFLQNRELAEGLRTSMFKLHLQENPHMIDEIKQLNNMKNLREEKSMEAVDIHNILKTGQDRTQDFIDDHNLDSKKLVAYVRQHKDTPKQYIIADVISGKNDPKLETFKKELIKKFKSKLTKEGLKNYIREALKKRLAENQPAPSREPGRETETIPDKGTEKEKKRRIGNPDKMPEKTPAKATATMNENEQEIIKQIVARFKSKK
jgi:hypothetical protein